MVTAKTYARQQTSKARRKEATSETRASAESLKNDLSDFRQRLTELASAGADEGMVAAQQMYERLHDTFEDVMSRPEFTNASGENPANGRIHPLHRAQAPAANAGGRRRGRGAVGLPHAPLGLGLCRSPHSSAVLWPSPR